MQNLELIQNKNGGYGIRDLDTGRVIIPGMYERKQLEYITEINPLSQFSKGYSSDIYLLDGRDENNKEVYGLYNALTNDFVETVYDRVSLVMNTNADSITSYEIMLIRGDERINFDLNVSHDNASVKQNVRIITNDNKTYGLANFDGEEIIPPQYPRQDIFNIGDIVKVFEGIYLIKGKDDPNKIIGFYDVNRNYLQKGSFTDYEIISGVLALKNKVDVVEYEYDVCSEENPKLVRKK